MPRALQKLCRNGNATSVTIPRAMLYHLGWLPGESVILELLEDLSVRVRRPSDRDFLITSPRLMPDSAGSAVKS